MLLADTSVWIEHFRRGKTNLTRLLDEGLVLMHPFVLGELACGNLNDRSVVLTHLNALPQAKLAAHAEVLAFTQRHKLWGKGLGWIDLNLLASAKLSNSPLWTFDKRLEKTAQALSLN